MHRELLCESMIDVVDGGEHIPSVAVRSEHHPAALCDVHDTVLRLDGHPTQLDVLRVSRAHARVLLDHGRKKHTYLLNTQLLFGVFK